MKISSNDRKLFDRLNKRYKEFKKKGVINNTWNLAINEVMSIYSDADMRGIDTSKWAGSKQNIFTMSKNIDDETLQQLRKVAKYLDKTQSSKISYYKGNKEIDERAMRAYQTLKNRPDNDIDNLQDYIDMLDDMEQSKEIKGIRDALSSDQIMRVYDYARSLNIKNADIEEIIRNGLKTMLKGDPLYRWLRNEMMSAYKTNDVDLYEE
jgi:hypothetical protein